jgi:proline dehydrogenase
VANESVDPRPAALTSPDRPKSRPAVLDGLRRRRLAPYGAGPGVDQAVAVCLRLARSGLGSTIGYAAKADETPRQVADIVQASFERLAAEGLDCYVSVKLSRLGFDPALVGELRAVAARSGRRLHFDALGPDSVDPTLALLEGAGDGPGLLGGTLPGRWQRSVDDCARYTALGLRLRVVKGQWAGGGSPDAELEAGFLRVIDRLAGYQGGVAVATHNAALLQSALGKLVGAKSPSEVELFLGMPYSRPAAIARDHGVPVRIYVPFGDTGAPYSLASLRSNPGAAAWLVEDLALGSRKRWLGMPRPGAGA